MVAAGFEPGYAQRQGIEQELCARRSKTGFLCVCVCFFYCHSVSILFSQVYTGLDIVTAKATKEEQRQAVHHLLDVARPDQAFTVTHFRERALPIVSFFPKTTYLSSSRCGNIMIARAHSLTRYTF